MDNILLKIITVLIAVSVPEVMLNTGMGSVGWITLIVPVTIVVLALTLNWIEAPAEKADPVHARLNHHWNRNCPSH